MFGVLASGRLVNTNVQQAGVDEYFMTLEDAATVNHIVVFLTGQVPFSEGFGGSIYLGWSNEGGDVSWQLLGFITNNKPSAIFKITKVKPSEVVNPFGQSSMATISQQPQPTAALIGIRVEQLVDMVQRTPASGTQATTVSSMQEFSQKMMENLFNFVSSFAVDPRQGTMTLGETYIPTSALQRWYNTFQRRLTANPNFWKTL